MQEVAFRFSMVIYRGLTKNEQKQLTFSSAENRRNNHHFCFLHIRIILCKKLDLKLAVFIFWTKFVQKYVPGRKQKTLI